MLEIEPHGTVLQVGEAGRDVAGLIEGGALKTARGDHLKHKHGQQQRGSEPRDGFLWRRGIADSLKIR
jgi:hypothetical protein